MENNQTLAAKKWAYFYEKLHDAIWYPHPRDWDKDDLMIEMFKMRDYLGNKETPVNTPDFQAAFSNGPYWKMVVKLCAETFKNP